MISICCFFGSCKKDKTSEPETYNIQFSAEALAYVQLPLNKYFIYKDSASGALDSVVVTQSNLKKQFAAPYVASTFRNAVPGFYYQEFSLLITKYNGTSEEDWFYGFATSSGVGPTIYNSDSANLNLLEKDRVNNKNLNYAFLYPFTPYSSLQENIAVIPSITIEGKIYTNVELYSYSNTTDNTRADYLKSTYYWAKGAGIIKREIKTSSSVKTKTLVRYG